MFSIAIPDNFVLNISDIILLSYPIFTSLQGAICQQLPWLSHAQQW
jgi:hypothetical protein